MILVGKEKDKYKVRIYGSDFLVDEDEVREALRTETLYFKVNQPVHSFAEVEFRFA